MKKTAFYLFLVSVFGLVNAQNAEAVCLDYWLKGPSACKEDPEEKKKILLKGGNVNLNIEKDEARLVYEKEMDVKIDKFLAGYGKPPREFVAFHLDPTLENAVRWVRKFNEDHERTMKIAVAWRQADRLFRQYKATGEILLPAESGVTEKELKYLKKAFEEDATDLPPVKGFGIDLPGSVDEDRLNRNYNKLTYKDAATKLTGVDRNSSLEEIEAKIEEQKEEKAKLEATVKAKKAEKAKKEEKKDKKAKKEKLEISYYFSATCPYCEKFKPELKKAIKDYGKENVELTCVDMTPKGGRTPNNVKGVIDCKWRQLAPGENTQYGVRSTPTLLVKRGKSNQLEMLENYHKAGALLQYFEEGAKLSRR